MATWTGQTKNTSAFTFGTKHTGTWDWGEWFLLQELGDFILQENGDKLILEPSSRSKNTASWSYGTKH